jgi:hypothetical protein
MHRVGHLLPQSPDERQSFQLAVARPLCWICFGSAFISHNRRRRAIDRLKRWDGRKGSSVHAPKQEQRGAAIVIEACEGIDIALCRKNENTLRKKLKDTTKLLKLTRTVIEKDRPKAISHISKEPSPLLYQLYIPVNSSRIRRRCMKSPRIETTT